MSPVVGGQIWSSGYGIPGFPGQGILKLKVQFTVFTSVGKYFLNFSIRKDGSPDFKIKIFRGPRTTGPVEQAWRPTRTVRDIRFPYVIQILPVVLYPEYQLDRFKS